PLIPHLPDDICILESAEQLAAGTPSPEVVAKLLNDFSEERRSTKRLRWIRRFAVLLLILLMAAVGFGFYANQQRNKAEASAKEAREQESKAKTSAREANRQLGNVNWISA